jgi:hypothetical protein
LRGCQVCVPCDCLPPTARTRGGPVIVVAGVVLGVIAWCAACEHVIACAAAMGCRSLPLG